MREGKHDLYEMKAGSSSVDHESMEFYLSTACQSSPSKNNLFFIKKNIHIFLLENNFYRLTPFVRLTLICLCILSVFIYPHILKYFPQILADKENHSSLAEFQDSVIISRVDLERETLEQGFLGFLFLEKWRFSFPLFEVTILSFFKKEFFSLCEIRVNSGLLFSPMV